jgi:ketosteroid isomerase-like protein
MFDENVELLRRGYAAFAEGDVDAVLELIDPDVEVEVRTGRPDVSEGEVYRGHEGFVRSFGEMMEVFDDFRIELEGLVEAGEQIIASVHVAGRGRASGITIDTRLFHVWSVRNGKAVRLVISNDREQALAAAGAAGAAE